ncbi:hypothetical protein D5S17_04325 [Pseudonocardiaceae bacterium YIM PH 21723]|nr:hypothetical protein D5S17_04325 [Pseudonocardiaceae bacterium YIM PH 21723]
MQKIEDLAAECERVKSIPRTIMPTRAVRLWVFGEVLDSQDDLDVVSFVCEADLPAEQVPWLCPPPGAGQWANATRVEKSPVQVYWRSAHAPIGNHRIVRPLLIWDEENGLWADTLRALRGGAADELREPAGDPENLQAELAIVERALRERTAAYEDKRWAPGKLEKIADPLFQAAQGYVDLLSAVGR